MKYGISLITGDGIGPEQAAAAKQILEAISDHSSTKFSIKEVEAGDAALKKHGKALPEFSVDAIKKIAGMPQGPGGRERGRRHYCPPAHV